MPEQAARIVSITSTDLFVGTADRPLQVVRVGVEGAAGATVRVEGDGVVTERPATVSAAGGQTVEVGVAVAATAGPGTTIPVRASLSGPAGARDTAAGELTVAEPGWTMFLVSHFHYDPVWWNTQAAYTCTWEAPDEPGAEPRTFRYVGHSGFNLVRAHTELALADPAYCFVLAEIDYLKPYWDAHPEAREDLRRLLAEGRIELMGGTYNEPNSNLTAAETTIRNAIYGIGFQRDVVGGHPGTAWQLDVFGHDPQFPGLMADAGLTSSSWARGPFHQWGPMLRTWSPDTVRPATVMQFRSEFEWLSPSGRGVLTHYMPAHYSAGWWMDSATTLAEAEEKTLELFHGLQPVALTRNILLPVGTDYTPPNKWVTQIHHDWNARYLWPRFVCGLPRQFFAAVRAELAERRQAPSPQTRDMNPIYTGKDVSFADTKQAHRAAESLITDAEKLATVAALLGARYPDAALDKAWRQLCYGAHHDAVTGSESDQVYLDLVTGWREAHDLAREVRDAGLGHVASQVDTAALDAAGGAAGPVTAAVVVANTMNWARTDVVRVRVSGPVATGPLAVVDATGTALPAVLAHAGTDADGVPTAVLDVVAPDVPGVGYRTFGLTAGAAAADTADAAAGWAEQAGTTIENAAFAVTVDPARGGAISSLRDKRSAREVLTPGKVGNEITVYEEYADHPEFGEGPWHLLPKGPGVGAATTTATVRRLVSPAGQRLEVTGNIGPVGYTQTLTCWAGVDRVDVATRIDRFTGSDQLVRVALPADVAGALPVSEVGDAVIGRGFGLIDADTATDPWTLDNPAYTWFALSSTARIALHDPAGAVVGRRAIGVAELVVGAEEQLAPLLRGLSIALARAGVTSTAAAAVANRYGALDVDSNLPDVRIAVGQAAENPFVAAVLAAAGPGYAAELDRQLAAHGRAVLFVPAARPLREVWVPSADLRETLALPVLVVAGVDGPATAAAVAAVAADLADGQVEVTQPAELSGAGDGAPGGSVAADDLDGYTVAILNRGMPGFAVDTAGTLHQSLLRSCTGWPSGVWIDPPRRTAPDGSAFQLQHWTHVFEYAFVAGAGDWRDVGLVAAGQGFNHPLAAVVEPVHAGPLPASATLLTVAPDARAVLATLKPHGNPIAAGQGGSSDPSGGITLRVYDATGLGSQVQVSAFVALDDGVKADLLEGSREPVKSQDGILAFDLDGAEVATVVATPGAAPAAAPPAPLGPETEPVQPVFTRYWLHNKGPAPIGYLPLAVHLAPEVARVDGPTTLRVTVASDLVDTAQSGRVRLTPPPGWSVEPAERLFSLAPAGYTAFDAQVTPPADPAPGSWYVSAEILDGRSGQRVEDVATLRVPDAAGALVRDELSIEVLDPAVSVAAGGRATVRVALANPGHGDVHGELHVVSPYGSWELVGPLAREFAVPAGGRTELAIDVAAPVDAVPGSTWLLAKVMWYGRLWYSPAVALHVTG